MERTIAETLHRQKLHQPPAALYLLLANLWKLLFWKRLGVSVEYKVDPRKQQGPFIVVSNHASRVDYLYTGIPFLPHRMNYVAGYNEFFRSHLALVFRLLQVIPKKNFVPDLYCVREIRRNLHFPGGNEQYFRCEPAGGAGLGEVPEELRRSCVCDPHCRRISHQYQVLSR